MEADQVVEELGRESGYEVVVEVEVFQIVEVIEHFFMRLCNKVLTEVQFEEIWNSLEDVLGKFFKLVVAGKGKKMSCSLIWI